MERRNINMEKYNYNVGANGKYPYILLSMDAHTCTHTTSPGMLDTSHMVL